MINQQKIKGKTDYNFTFMRRLCRGVNLGFLFCFEQ